MAKWRKRESLGHAMAREGKGIAKGVFKGLCTIATMGLYRGGRTRFVPRKRRKR